MKKIKLLTTLILTLALLSNITIVNAYENYIEKPLFSDDISWGTSKSSSTGFVSEKNSALSYSDDASLTNSNYIVASGTSSWKAYNERIAAKGARFSHGNLRIGGASLVQDKSYIMSADIFPANLANTQNRNAAGIKFDADGTGTSFYWFGFEDPGSGGADAYKVALRKSASGDTYNTFGVTRLATYTLITQYRSISQNANRPFTLTVSIVKEDGKNIINYEIQGTKTDGTKEILWEGTYEDTESPLSGSQVLLYKTGETTTFFDNINITELGDGIVSAELPFYDEILWGTAQNESGGYSAEGNGISYMDDASKKNDVYQVINGLTYWKAFNGKIVAKGNRFTHGNVRIGSENFVQGISYNFSADILQLYMTDTTARNSAGIKFNANSNSTSFYSLCFEDPGAEGLTANKIALRKSVSDTYHTSGAELLASCDLPEEYIGISQNDRPFTFYVSVKTSNGKNNIYYEVKATKQDYTQEVIWSGVYTDADNPIFGSQVMLYKTGQSMAFFDNILVEENTDPDISIDELADSYLVKIDTVFLPQITVNDDFIYSYYNPQGKRIEFGRVIPTENAGTITVNVPKNNSLGAIGKLHIWNMLAPRIANIQLN